MLRVAHYVESQENECGCASTQHCWAPSRQHSEPASLQLRAVQGSTWQSQPGELQLTAQTLVELSPSVATSPCMEGMCVGGVFAPREVNSCKEAVKAALLCAASIELDVTQLATSLLSKPSRALGVKSTILHIRSDPCFSDLAVIPSLIVFSPQEMMNVLSWSRTTVPPPTGCGAVMLGKAAGSSVSCRVSLLRDVARCEAATWRKTGKSLR